MLTAFISAWPQCSAPVVVWLCSNPLPAAGLSSSSSIICASAVPALHAPSPRLSVGMLIPGVWGCSAAWSVLGLGSHSPSLHQVAQCHSLCPQVLWGVPAALPASAIPSVPALPHALRSQEGGEGFQRGEAAFILQGSLQRLQQEGKAHRGRLPPPILLPVPWPEITCCWWLGWWGPLFRVSPLQCGPTLCP